MSDDPRLMTYDEAVALVEELREQSRLDSAYFPKLPKAKKPYERLLAAGFVLERRVVERMRKKGRGGCELKTPRKEFVLLAYFRRCGQEIPYYEIVCRTLRVANHLMGVKG